MDPRMTPAALEVSYARGHGNQPVTMTAAQELDALVDRVRIESPQDAPTLARPIGVEWQNCD
jgi:hypothetical protein